MLTIENLKGINENISLSDISLKLYKEFFENVLCKKIFIYTLENKEKIKLKFEPTNLMHLLGAHHILGERFKANRFNDEIVAIENPMTFQKLQKRNSQKFNDDTNRYLGFANIYHLLNNCKMISFNKDLYNKNKKGEEDSSMNFKYIVYEDLNGKKLHLGLDTYNNGRNFYGKSLLVKSSQNDVLIRGQVKFNITNIQVEDKLSWNKTSKEVAATKMDMY